MKNIIFDCAKLFVADRVNVVHSKARVQSIEASVKNAVPMTEDESLQSLMAPAQRSISLPTALWSMWLLTYMLWYIYPSLL